MQILLIFLNSSYPFMPKNLSYIQRISMVLFTLFAFFVGTIPFP